MAPSEQHHPRSILVGSDLSEASDRIIQEAARIADRGGARLHVVSAYPPSVSSFDRNAEQLPSDAVLAEVNRALPAQIRRILPEPLHPETQEVRFGSPARIILDRAREIEADLLILGPHRGRDVHAHFLGTTADEVLRDSEIPCLALRGTLPIPIGRIGVATDFSEIGNAALACALDWATWLGAAGGEDDTIVCAAHVRAPDEGGDTDDPASQLESSIRAVTTGRDLPMGIQPSSEVLEDADIASALAGWAERSGLDLLVIGTHGKSGWQRSNLGSVSSALARRAACPVLLVPAGDRGDRTG
ncbi:MAG: universal stress protein [Gemmatimonadota bacterium]